MFRSLSRPRILSLEHLLAHTRTPLFRNAYALLVSSATTSGLGLVYWVLAARFYSVDVVGMNAGLISIMIFLSGVSQFGLMSAMIRYIPRAGSTTRHLVLWTYAITITAGCIAGIGFLIGARYWSSSFAELTTSPWLSLWFVLGICAWSVFALQDSILTGLRQAVWVPLENIAYGAIKIIMMVMLAMTFTSTGIFVSWTVPMMVALIPVNCLIFWRLIPNHIARTAADEQPATPRQITHYVAGNYAASLFQLSANRLVPVIVLQQVGAVANALFYLPWMLSTAIKQVTMNMVMSLTVEGAVDHDKLHHHSYQLMVQLLRLLVPLIAVLFVAAPLLLRFSGSSYAASGTTLLKLLVVSTVPNTILSLYIGIARVQQRVLGIMAVQALACCLSLGLSFPFLRQYGITGIGYAVLLSESLVAAGIVIVHARQLLRILVITRGARPRQQ